MVELEGIEKRFRYEADTGVFHRLYKWGNLPVGSVAGWLIPCGYIQMRFKGKQHYAHRLAFWFMLGAMPNDFVDHINGVREDNRWSNLREATNSENMRNMKVRGGTSKYKGVYKDGNRWRARIISKEFGRKHLGTFSCEKEAALSYNEAALEHFGSFARLNEVET
jgi:hypothetical protein